MKALTVQQPFATLIMTGLKRYECRTWTTNYRGPIAIHSSQSPVMLEAFHRQHYDWFYHHKLTSLQRDFPRGVILGTINIIEAYPPHWWTADRLDPVTRGYASPRLHWAWELEEPEWLSTPIAHKGALSLWEVPTELMYPHLLEAQHAAP